jgi:hypothetical protein
MIPDDLTNEFRALTVDVGTKEIEEEERESELLSQAEAGGWAGG